MISKAELTSLGARTVILQLRPGTSVAVESVASRCKPQTLLTTVEDSSKKSGSFETFAFGYLHASTSDKLASGNKNLQGRVSLLCSQIGQTLPNAKKYKSSVLQQSIIIELAKHVHAIGTRTRAHLSTAAFAHSRSGCCAGSVGSTNLTNQAPANAIFSLF
eukprot:1065323-Pleurochrysis_carterae.AAC.3